MPCVRKRFTTFTMLGGPGLRLPSSTTMLTSCFHYTRSNCTLMQKPSAKPL